MTNKRSDIAFTDSVKRAQSRNGSREMYERVTSKGDWPGEVTERLRTFLESLDTVFLGTATAQGQPYIQHRGGPPGFVKVLDERTLAFADYAGNRQYISEGNLDENELAFLFLIDFPHRRRMKVWGRARFTEDPDIVARVLDPEGPPAERALVFEVDTWDINCPQHITPRFTEAEWRERDQRDS